MNRNVFRLINLGVLTCLITSCSLFVHPTFTWDWRRDHPQYHEMAKKMILTESPEILTVIPADVEAYAPNYKTWSQEERLEYWALMLSIISWMESSHRTEHFYEEVGIIDSTGNNVTSRGLLQFSFESSRAYAPEIKKPEDLHIPEMTLKAGAVAFRRFLTSDKVISAGRKGEWRGLARYWSVLRNNEKHENIKKWMRNADWENPRKNLIPPPPHLTEAETTPWMTRFFSNPVKAMSEELKKKNE